MADEADLQFESMDASVDKPQQRPLGLHDCYGMMVTTVCWLLLTGTFSLAALQDIPFSSAAKTFVSSLCGPFAFFEREANRPTLNVTLPWALLCLTPVGLHLFVRHTATAIFAAFGISLWFLLGLALTFISV